MNQTLTVVMYHFVRPIKGSRFPRIRGLELNDFEGQLDYIQRHYRVISAGDVVAFIRGERQLPQPPLLLTFDDGYADHHRHVLPALQRRGLPGVFFPPARAVQERRLLDVNQIHFILASVENLSEVIGHIDGEVSTEGMALGLKSVGDYRQEFWRANRFDEADTNYVKRMLQVALPKQLRENITHDLFRRFVSCNERDFADGLYLSENQLHEMIDAGMTIGSHGSAHDWLNNLSLDDQAADIDVSLKMLERLGALREHFLFCYPYGAYTEGTLALLKKRNCAAAFTTKPRLAQMGCDDMLELPRIDTNDLPRYAEAETALLTKEAHCRGVH